jgi:hypothetical protein
MKNQNTTKTGQCSADPVFLFQSPVQSDYPLTTKKKQDIARQASVARGWLRTLGVR